MFTPEVIGRVLTAIGIGLGPSFLYDLTEKPEPPEVTIHFNEA
jgi:xanthine/uracil permease